MLYNKMKEWYHPEHVIKKGTRLLHYHPKGIISYIDIYNIVM